MCACGNERRIWFEALGVRRAVCQTLQHIKTCLSFSLWVCAWGLGRVLKTGRKVTVEIAAAMTTCLSASSLSVFRWKHVNPLCEITDTEEAASDWSNLILGCRRPVNKLTGTILQREVVTCWSHCNPIMLGWSVDHHGCLHLYLRTEPTDSVVRLEYYCGLWVGPLLQSGLNYLNSYCHKRCCTVRTGAGVFGHMWTLRACGLTHFSRNSQNKFY